MSADCLTSWSGANTADNPSLCLLWVCRREPAHPRRRYVNPTRRIRFELLDANQGEDLLRTVSSPKLGNQHLADHCTTEGRAVLIPFFAPADTLRGTVECHGNQSVTAKRPRGNTSQDVAYAHGLDTARHTAEPGRPRLSRLPLQKAGSVHCVWLCRVWLGF